MPRKSRKKGKTPLKDDLTQITKEEESETFGLKVQEGITVKDEPKPLKDDALIPPDLAKIAQVETALLTAPRLPFKYPTGYVGTDFRKAYVGLLKNLVELFNLPYLVNQEAILTRKE